MVKFDTTLSAYRERNGAHLEWHAKRQRANGSRGGERFQPPARQLLEAMSGEARADDMPGASLSRRDEGSRQRRTTASHSSFASILFGGAIFAVLHDATANSLGPDLGRRVELAPPGPRLPTLPNNNETSFASEMPVSGTFVPQRHHRVPRSQRTARFKSIGELKKDILGKMPPHEQVRFQIPVNGKINGYREKWLFQKALEMYHRQFDAFINNKVPSIAKNKVKKYERSGYWKEALDHKPKNIWSIDRIDLYTLLRLRSGVELTRALNMPAYVTDMPDGGYLFIGPEGSLKRLRSNIAETKNSAALLRLLNISLPNFTGYRFLNAEVTARANTQNLSVSQLAEERAREHITSHIRKLEAENEPSEWRARLQIIEEMLEDTALALSVVAAPVVGPEELAVEAAVEAVEAEVIEEGAVQGARVLADARLGIGETLADSLLREPEIASPDVIGDEAVQASDDLQLSEGEALQRCRRGNICGADGQAGEALAFDPASILNRAYAKVAAEHGVTPEFVANFIDQEAAEEIPEFLYRGQSGGTIQSSWGTVGDDRLDDYLTALLKHTGNTEGGENASLSAVRSVAREFASARPNGQILRIETGFDRANFRSAADLIKNEGPRLVAEGKLDEETLAEAIDNMVVASKTGSPEKEVFYIRGSIPNERVHSSGVPI